jgi:phosphatidylglycerophosphate synthase
MTVEEPSSQPQPNATDVDLARAAKPVDAWWTVLVVDRLVLPILPRIVRNRRITPDNVTAVGLALAVGAAVAFAKGALVVGAVAFELHFFLDCIDGKLARVRRTQNPRGAFLDLGSDLVATSACYGGLGYAALSTSSVPYLAFAPAVLYVVYTWSTLYRRAVAAPGPAVTSKAEPSRYRAFMARHRLSPAPYGVELESGLFFVLPLLGSHWALRGGLVCASAFYFVAASRNARATARALPASVTTGEAARP